MPSYRHRYKELQPFYHKRRSNRKYNVYTPIFAPPNQVWLRRLSVLSFIFFADFFVHMWLTDGQPEVDRGFFARPNSPRRTNTIPLSPVTGITLKKICYATIFAVADTSPFFIGYTALNILYIQGLLHATPYVFKFYADICQVQDFFYLVTYIICRKNIVFGQNTTHPRVCGL